MKKIVKTGLTLLLGGSVGAGLGAAITGKISAKSTNKKSEKVDKFKTYYNMLNQWLLLKQEGKSLEDYFIESNIKTIAIYGMGEMGNRLYDELKNSKVEVKYAIDKEAESIYSELDVRKLEDGMPFVDAVIVTAVFAFEDIKNELASSVDYQIISLEDVVYEV